MRNKKARIESELSLLRKRAAYLKGMLKGADSQSLGYEVVSSDLAAVKSEIAGLSKQLRQSR